MKQKLPVLLLLMAFILAPALNLHARTMYVRNWMTISVRATPDEASQIVDNAATNDAVQVIEAGGGWSHIKTKKGKDGWVPSRYLTIQMPVSVSAQQCAEQVKALQEENKKIQDDNKKLQDQIAARQGAVQPAAPGKAQAQAPVPAGIADCTSVQKQYDKLQNEHKVLTDKYSALMEENSRLKTSERLTFTVIGGVFVILGIIVGLLLQIVRAHPKKGGLRF